MTDYCEKDNDDDIHFLFWSEANHSGAVSKGQHNNKTLLQQHDMGSIYLKISTTSSHLHHNVVVIVIIMVMIIRLAIHSHITQQQHQQQQSVELTYRHLNDFIVNR